VLVARDDRAAALTGSVRVMVQSVELLLDPATDAAVREQWAALGAAGLRHSGQHTGASNRPHVTLAVAPDLPADREPAIAAAVAGLPIPLRLGGLVLFGHRSEYVLARLVVPSAELLALQAAVHRATADDRIAHLAPGAWTPHVTLGRRYHAADLAVALALPDLAADLTGTGVAVRRWDSDARRDWIVG
jgi:2'-5' RNA ligase